MTKCSVRNFSALLFINASPSWAIFGHKNFGLSIQLPGEKFKGILERDVCASKASYGGSVRTCHC